MHYVQHDTINSFCLKNRSWLYLPEFHLTNIATQPHARCNEFFRIGMPIACRGVNRLPCQCEACFGLRYELVSAMVAPPAECRSTVRGENVVLTKYIWCLRMFVLVGCANRAFSCSSTLSSILSNTRPIPQVANYYSFITS